MLREWVNIMCPEIMPIIKKKRVLIGLFIFILFVFILFLFSCTPFLINLFGFILKAKSGFELNARGFNIRPGLIGNVEFLSIRGGDGFTARAMVERINFDGRLIKGLMPEISFLAFDKPVFELEVKSGFTKDASVSKEPLEEFPVAAPKRNSGKPKGSPCYFLPIQDFIKKFPYIKRIDLKGGAFSLKLPGDMGTLKLLNAFMQVSDGSKDGGGSLFFKGDLYLSSSSFIVSSRGKIELAIDFRDLASEVSGTGSLLLTLSEFSAKDVILKGLEIKSSISVKGCEIQLPEFNISLKALDFTKESLPSFSGLEFNASLAFNTESGLLRLSDLRILLPERGAIEGDLDMRMLEGFAWQASFYGKDFLLTEISDIIAPFLSPENRGWSFHGRGGLVARIKGGMTGGKWGIEGDLEVEIKGGGFSSPDGTKGGEGINVYITLDIDYPQDAILKEDDRLSFKTKWKVDGGEYLWETVYRDLTGYSLILDAEGFFLQILKG